MGDSQETTQELPASEIVVLEINRFDSKCLACGNGASLNETSHDTQLGWGDHPPNGCGKKFTHWTTGYGFGGKPWNGIPWMEPGEAYRIYNERQRQRNG